MRKKMHRYIATGFFLVAPCLLWQGCNKGIGKRIPFVGLNDGREEVTQVMTFDHRGRSMELMIRKLQSAAEEALNVRDSKPGPWELSRVDVGVGLTSEIGIGVVGVSAQPAFRLTFERRT